MLNNKKAVAFTECYSLLFLNILYFINYKRGQSNRHKGINNFAERNVGKG